MPKVRHGGKRFGAGRKRALTPEEELWVGTEAHNRMAAIQDARFLETARNLIPEDVQLRWAILKAVPVAQRPTRTRPSHVQDLIGDVRDGTARLGRRAVRVPKPQGIRPLVLMQVAEDATKRFSKPISPRLVKACLEQYRAILARLPS